MSLLPAADAMHSQHWQPLNKLQCLKCCHVAKILDFGHYFYDSASVPSTIQVPVSWTILLIVHDQNMGLGLGFVWY